MMMTGYVPDVQGVDEKENELLTFRVAGRESLLTGKGNHGNGVGFACIGYAPTL